LGKKNELSFFIVLAVSGRGLVQEVDQSWAHDGALGRLRQKDHKFKVSLNYIGLSKKTKK
jgi:hypothetical protein